MTSALKSVPHGERLLVPDTHMNNTNVQLSSEESESESAQPVEDCGQNHMRDRPISSNIRN